VTADHLIIGPRSAEIVPGDVSGGTNTSHTIVISALAALLEALPAGATHAEYERAALESNLLGKQTDGGRRRTFRYLKELYLLSCFGRFATSGLTIPKLDHCWQGSARLPVTRCFGLAAQQSSDRALETRSPPAI
jgi:hypothetical protein